MGFEIYRERSAGAEGMQGIRPAASVQFITGDACKLVNGDLAKCGATDKVFFLFSVLETPAALLRPGTANLSDATAPMIALAEPVGGRDLIAKTPLVGSYAPKISGVACNANSDPTSVLITFAGATNDYTLGTVYCPELNQTRHILTDTQASGVKTFVLDFPFTLGKNTVALSTGYTVTAVPFQIGTQGIRLLDAQGLDTSVAGKAGGTIRCEGVDLSGPAPFALVSFPQLQ